MRFCSYVSVISNDKVILDSVIIDSHIYALRDPNYLYLVIWHILFCYYYYDCIMRYRLYAERMSQGMHASNNDARDIMTIFKLSIETLLLNDNHNGSAMVKEYVASHLVR